MSNDALSAALGYSVRGAHWRNESTAHVLYIAARFPVESETFVLDEAVGMAERGLLAGVAALARPTSEQIARAGASARTIAPYTTYSERFSIENFSVAIASLSNTSVRSAMSDLARIGVNVWPRLLRAAAVARIANRVKANMLYAHWPRPTEVAFLASRISGIPFAVSVHAHEVVHDARHFPIVLPHCSFAAFCNRAAMDKLSDTLSRKDREKMHLIYHGIDPIRFSNDNGKVSAGNGLHVMSAGRLTPTKGFDRLLRAIAAAHASGVVVRLTILGDGSERAALEALAGALGISAFTVFLGWVPRDDVPRVLAQGDVFALLANTDFHDGLPNVVLEAMSIGLPAIISPLPAAPEAIDDGINGCILRSPDDVDGFVAACRLFLTQPGLRAEWGAKAAERIRLDHNKPLQLDRLASLLRASARVRAD